MPEIGDRLVTVLVCTGDNPESFALGQFEMILAILQARVSSCRFPGKVLKPLLGEPMLARQIERVKRSRSIDRLVVATSNDASDDLIEELCDKLEVDCFRGSLDDVLDRFYQAAKAHGATDVVRLTGDCPLIDPEVIDEVIQLYRTGEYDYASNTLEPTFPDGLDIEVFRFECLEQAWREAKLSSEREHVTLAIHRHPERYKLGMLKKERNLSALRWTVDEPDDYELITKFYEALYPVNPEFGFEDLVRHVDANPELMTYNTGHRRNEGLEKSLAQDGNSLEKK